MEGGTLQKKRCSKREGIERMFLSSSVEDAKVAALSLFSCLGFSTDLWQTFFTLSQREQNSCETFTPKEA